jgi:hypothetical protein
VDLVFPVLLLLKVAQPCCSEILLEFDGIDGELLKKRDWSERVALVAVEERKKSRPRSLSRFQSGGEDSNCKVASAFGGSATKMSERE